MNNQLTIFDFDDTAVRVIDQDGAPWFVAADICRILEIQNPTDALKGLDDDERMTLANPEGHSGQRGGAQIFNIISESGLYALIFKSRKEEARRFRKWVTSEVLPQIRKTGGYALHEAAKTQSALRDMDSQTARISDLMQEVAHSARYNGYPQDRARTVCALGGRALEALRLRLELAALLTPKVLPAAALPTAEAA
jgi:prophage antirepressor-like protein